MTICSNSLINDFIYSLQIAELNEKIKMETDNANKYKKSCAELQQVCNIDISFVHFYNKVQTIIHVCIILFVLKCWNFLYIL